MAELIVSRDLAITVAAELVRRRPYDFPLDTERATALDEAIVPAVSLLRSFGDENAKLRAQRAALLAACKAVEAHLGTTFPPYPLSDSPFDKVRVAIALCEQESPPDPTPVELERGPTH